MTVDDGLILLLHVLSVSTVYCMRAVPVLVGYLLESTGRTAIPEYTVAVAVCYGLVLVPYGYSGVLPVPYVPIPVP